MRGRRSAPICGSSTLSERPAGRWWPGLQFLSRQEDNLLWLWSAACRPPTKCCWKGFRRRYGDAPEELDGVEIIDELRPRADELRIEKYGYGAFHDTDLDARLRALDVRSLVVARDGHANLRRGDGAGGVSSRLPHDDRVGRGVVLRAGPPRRDAEELRDEVRLGGRGGYGDLMAVHAAGRQRFAFDRDGIFPLLGLAVLAAAA